MIKVRYSEFRILTYKGGSKEIKVLLSRDDATETGWVTDCCLRSENDPKNTQHCKPGPKSKQTLLPVSVSSLLNYPAYFGLMNFIY